MLRSAAVLETGSRLVGGHEPVGPVPVPLSTRRRGAHRRAAGPGWSVPWLTLGVFLVYCGVALAAYWPILLGDSRFVAGYGGDPEQQVWFLA